MLNLPTCPTIRALRILALMEHAPKYGVQIVNLMPDISVSSIHMVLHRLKRQKLVRRRPSYVPPADMKVPATASWYEITTDGRKALREGRDIVRPILGD